MASSKKQNIKKIKKDFFPHKLKASNAYSKV